MQNVFWLPISFLQFWYIESPMGLIRYFESINRAFFQLFSLTLFLKTFFKPIKNEYRQGLVRFSIFMGIAIKTVLILVDLVLLMFLLTVEFAVLFIFLTFPILTVFVLF